MQRLERAKRDFEEGYYEDSVGRAYYALYHATKACLALKSSYPKTHRGLISEFGRLYIRTGEVEPKYGEILSTAKVLRERGEYDAFTVIEKNVAKQKLIDAEEFLKRIREITRGSPR